MPDPGTTTREISAALALLATGHPDARNRLWECAADRLRRLASRLLNQFWSVRDREQSDDVLHSLYLRLHDKWGETLTDRDNQPIRDASEFIRRASRLLRDVLGNELQKILGKPTPPPLLEKENKNGDANTAEGLRQHPPPVDPPASQPSASVRKKRPAMLPLQTGGSNSANEHDPGTEKFDPVELAILKEVARLVDELPEDLRVVVDLHYYQGLTFAEVAVWLTTTKGVVIGAHGARKRWIKAKGMLTEKLGGADPFR